MNQAHELPTLNIEADKAIPRIIQILNCLGMQVVRSFDLRSALAGQISCRCPNHGTDQCDCQMVVLLIYYQEAAPLTLVAHGHSGKTYLSIVYNPQQLPAPGLSETICQALLADAYS